MAPPAPSPPPPLPVRGPAVTGVGSLPISDAAEAVRFVAAHAPEVPFWPQLPALGPQEGMLRQALGVPAGLLREERAGLLRVAPGARAALLDALVEDDPAVTGDQAAGFGALRQSVRDGALPRAWAVKGQMAGPGVLARCVLTGAGTVGDDEELRTAVVDRLVARARWQAIALLELGLPAVVVVDDPMAAQATQGPAGPDPLARVLDAIAGTGAVAGFHSCATAAQLPEVRALDMVSLDLFERDLPPVARHLWARGGWLAAGLVPTMTGPAGLPSPQALADRWQELAASSGDPGDLVGRTLLTATCGLAGGSRSDAAGSFTRAAEVAALIEGAHG